MDWETPASVFGPLDAEFKFTLDVCASVHNAKCDRFFSEKDDGLAQSWSQDTCWMNPPYGRAIKLWMRKALNESRRGATVVALVPARTDTEWWHECSMQGQVRFLRGRIRFVGAKYSAPFPSAIVVFTPQARAARAPR